MTERAAAAVRHVVPWLALLLVLAGAAWLYLSLAWTADLGSHSGDGATYVLIARYYAGAHGGVAQEYAASTFYPPLFPWVLAILGGANSMLIANLATTSFMLVAFALLFAYARLAGVGPWLALLAVGIFVAAPANYLQTMMVQSENLYVMLSLGALVFAGLFERHRRPLFLVGLASCAAATSLTRSAGVALLVSLCVFALRHGWRAWLAAVAAAAPAIAWRTLHRSAPGYSTHLMTHLPRGASDWLAFAQHQLETWQGAWPSVFGVSTAAGWLLVWIVAALGVAGATAQSLRLRLDGLYTLTYTVMVALWPYPAEAQRLLLVVAPLLVVQALIALRWLGHKLVERVPLRPLYADAPALIVAAPLLLTMLPAMAIVVDRYRSAPPDMERYRHLPEWYGPLNDRSLQLQSRDAFVRAMKSLATRPEIGPADCIYATRPSVVAFYSGHRGVMPPLENLDAAAFDAALRSEGCNFILMTAFTSPTFSTPFYPSQRLQGRLEVLETFSRDPGDPSKISAVVARLRPEPG